MTTRTGYPDDTRVEERIILALPPGQRDGKDEQDHETVNKERPPDNVILKPPVVYDTSVAELLLEYMWVKDAAIYLDVSTSRIYTMILNGKFGAVIVDGARKKWLVRRCDVVEYKRYRNVGVPSFPRVSRYVPHSPQDNS